MKSPIIIAIAGGSSSGKTSVAQSIVAGLEESVRERAVVISLDSFYRELNEAENELAAKNEYDFDSPDAFENGQILKTLEALQRRETVVIPSYDVLTHKRKDGEGTTINGAEVDIIIIEGIFALLRREIRKLVELKIFISTDPDLRLIKRVLRDIQERGKDVIEVFNDYQRFVKPSFDRYTGPSQRHADLTIRGVDNGAALDLLTTHVNSLLKRNE